MTIGAAIFLIALGAIFRYAVSDTIDGVELGTIGLILMIAGAAGIVFELLRETLGRHRRTERTIERGGEPVQHEEVRETY